MSSQAIQCKLQKWELIFITYHIHVSYAQDTIKEAKICSFLQLTTHSYVTIISQVLRDKINLKKTLRSLHSNVYHLEEVLWKDGS
jgi:hypothetical protein